MRVGTRTRLQPLILAMAAAALCFGQSVQPGTKNVPWGYAPLDGSGKVPAANLPSGGGGGLPAGAVMLILSGTCPTGYTEATELNGVTLIGTLAANGDVGSTGGANNITPAGTFSGTPATLAHSGAAVSAHTGAAVGNHAVTQPTIAWPAAVPPFLGTSSTCVPNHVHVENINTATTGGLGGFPALIDTSTSGSTATGLSTANNTGGSANCTPAGTNSWPAGVPVASGAAVDAHSVTQPANHSVTQASDHSYTPAGTFAGSSFDNRSAFVRVIFCKKS
jgi:hypothetical protein